MSFRATLAFIVVALVWGVVFGWCARILVERATQ